MKPTVISTKEDKLVSIKTYVPYYYNTKTKKTVSFFGSCPWFTEEEKKDWVIKHRETTEYTNHNGTITYGRPAM